MVDAGPDNPPQLGDVAILIGTDGDAAISLDQFANWSGTVSYEVLTRLARDCLGYTSMRSRVFIIL